MGLCLIIMGLALYIVSIVQFSRPAKDGINTKGLYSISRNPMYVSFFLYFAGCCLLTRSCLLLTVLLIFQISVHFLIISEERWCKDQFGQSYSEYMKKVRRYI
jgi:protein-S-isoprenylcysteine O-methyltransferase Ste14